MLNFLRERRNNWTLSERVRCGLREIRRDSRKRKVIIVFECAAQIKSADITSNGRRSA